MKPSKKDKWIDRIISRASATDKNKPVPDFDKWQQEHPDAVQKLKSQASRQWRKNFHNNKYTSREPFMFGLHPLARAFSIAALFLIAVSCTICFILVRENRMLKQDLQLARQEIDTNIYQQKIVEAQNNQHQAISNLHIRVEELEKNMRRGISPRMVWYSEAPYYIPERRGEL